MRLITIICSGISISVLYVAMLFIVIISFVYDVIGTAMEKITDLFDYFLNDQLQVLFDALNGESTDAF